MTNGDEMINAYKFLVEKPEAKNVLRRPGVLYWP
jgi:hypothetical protein